MPSSPPEPSAAAVHRRGGQPGNTNALKHGFYARDLPLEDTAGLDDLPLDTLADEITFLRILIRRVAANTAARETPEKSVEHLRVVGIAMLSLTRLMRTQIYLRANRTTKIPAEYLLPYLHPAASAPRRAAARAPANEHLPDDP